MIGRITALRPVLLCGIVLLLGACGNTRLQHCTNFYDDVAQGNVAELEAEKAEVVSQIPDDNAGEKLMSDTARVEEQAPTEEELEAAIPDEGDVEGGVPVEAMTPAEPQPKPEDVNRRTSESAKKKAEDLKAKALKEMGVAH